VPAGPRRPRSLSSACISSSEVDDDARNGGCLGERGDLHLAIGQTLACHVSAGCSNAGGLSYVLTAFCSLRGVKHLGLHNALDLIVLAASSTAHLELNSYQGLGLLPHRIHIIGCLRCIDQDGLGRQQEEGMRPRARQEMEKQGAEQLRSELYFIGWY
jgi:hypothetical protein